MFDIFQANSPLEQFLLVYISIFNLSVKKSVLTYYLLVFLGIAFIFAFFVDSNKKIKLSQLINNQFHILSEGLYRFIFEIYTSNVKDFLLKYFPAIFATFFTILFFNLIGMIPFNFTVTSQLFVTHLISLTWFQAFTVLGLMLHKEKFFGLFFPGGAPLALSPLLVVIEIVSYIFRGHSLSIRLFANMMSGHALLKILASFIYPFFSKIVVNLSQTFYELKSFSLFDGYYKFLLLFHNIKNVLLFVIPLSFITIITGLEFGIAFLQAYVFTFLLCIYISDVKDLH